MKNKKIGKFPKVKAPVDYAFLVNGKRKEFCVDELPINREVMDIGFETARIYVDEIKKAKCIFMKGPVGYCEKKEFCHGTHELLKAIAGRGVFSVVGGGHLSNALEKIGINKKKFGYVSLSGGALVRYVAGEKLVGLEALKKSPKISK